METQRDSAASPRSHSCPGAELRQAGSSTFCLLVAARSLFLPFPRASLVAQMVKNLPAVQETWVQLLGQEDPLEKGLNLPLLHWQADSLPLSHEKSP